MRVTRGPMFGGLSLLNISTAGTDIATAVVLLVAVAVDSTLRRRGRSGTA